MLFLRSFIVAALPLLTLSHAIPQADDSATLYLRDVESLGAVARDLSAEDLYTREINSVYFAELLRRNAEPVKKASHSSKNERKGKNADKTTNVRQKTNKQQYNQLNWSKSGHDYAKNDPSSHGHRASEKAAKAAIKHNTKTGNFPKNGDYSIRAGIHTNKDAKKYFGNDKQNWVTLQGPGNGGTVAHHVPVNGKNKYDPKIGVKTFPGPGMPGNKNSGKTQVPGDGPRVNRRFLEAREAYEAGIYARAAEAYQNGLDSRDAEAFAEYEDAVYQRDAEAKAEAFCEEYGVFT